MPEIDPTKDRIENPRIVEGETATPIEDESDPYAEEEATPEEQETYDMIVARALTFMHGDGQKNILKMLGSGETPAKGLGLVTANIAQMMNQSATEGGREVTPETLLNASAEIMEELNDMAQAAGIFKYDNEQEATEQIEDAMGLAMKYYGDMDLQAGKITPELQEEAQMEVRKGVEREQAQMKPVDAGVKQALGNNKKPGMIQSAMGGM